jgi:hypothetical protein
MTMILQPPPKRWTCPNCLLEDVTPGNITNRYHRCLGLAGITAPMVPAGSGSRVRAVAPEDYVGDALVQRDGFGRPIAAIYTDRPDGSNDCVVLAPTAQLKMEASGS